MPSAHIPIASFELVLEEHFLLIEIFGHGFTC